MRPTTSESSEQLTEYACAWIDASAAESVLTADILGNEVVKKSCFVKGGRIYVV